MFMLARTIGIIGRNFSGSTIIQRFFSAIPEVFSAGEIHWLIDAPMNGSIATKEGRHVTRHCIVCGKSCPIFTTNFTNLEHPPKKLYPRVAKQAQTNILVSSDKLDFLYKRFVEPKSMDGIVIFKCPEADAASHIRNERWPLMHSIIGYHKTYNHILKWAPVFCKSVIFVSYEELVSKPNEYMKVICDKLCVSISNDVTNFEKVNYHHIGGNPRAHNSKKVKLDNKWRQELTIRQKNIITNNREVQETYRTLLKKRVII
jgi:hypothetical protein